MLEIPVATAHRFLSPRLVFSTSVYQPSLFENEMFFNLRSSIRIRGCDSIHQKCSRPGEGGDLWRGYCGTVCCISPGREGLDRCGGLGAREVSEVNLSSSLLRTGFQCVCLFALFFCSSKYTILVTTNMSLISCDVYRPWNRWINIAVYNVSVIIY